MILLQQVATDTANTPVLNWTAIGVIIAAGVLIVTIVLAVIGRAFKLNAKVTRVETKIDGLTDTVSTLGANLENFKLNVINLIARGSPSYLTKEGVEIAKNTGVAKLVEDHYKEILSVVRDTEPANTYRAQEALLSAVRNLQYDDECRNVLETAAYESGYPISTIYTIGGYYIRDRVINELGFSKDDIDKHDPEQKEKKPNSHFKNNKTMSSPSAPYYYKETGSDSYHWERSCSKNHYPDPGWKKTDTRPSGREQCNECKGK